MKSLEQTLSPLSWAVFTLGFLYMIPAIFKPSLAEFAVFILVDYIALQGMRKFDRAYLTRFYPDIRPFFFGTQIEEIKTYSLSETRALFHSMVSFPAKRALYCFITSFLKALPALFIIVFFWEHEVSNFTQFLTALSLSLFMWAYFYGAIYIENHAFISKEISKLHQRLDWSELFRTIKLEKIRNDFELHENAALVSIWIFMVSTQWMLVTTGGTKSGAWLSFEVVLVGVAGLILISRIWYLGRKYFIGELKKLFNVLEEFHPSTFRNTLPLHSYPLLARFEQNFNTMMEQIRSYEQELSHWIFVRTERERYQALGEISGLIVHDLSAPLHVLNFCVHQLNEDPERIKDLRYREQLIKNSHRSLDLIDSLKAYLKNQNKGKVDSSIWEAYEPTLKLLKAQFFDSQVSDIQIDMDPRLKPIRFKLTQADLMHVLLNLLANSAQNLIENNINLPRIKIRLESEIEDRAKISITNNGTGLSKDRFEELTGFVYLSDKSSFSREGLGLRLVRRLLERSGGGLTVSDVSPESGTKFVMTLLKNHAEQEINFIEQLNTEEAKNEQRNYLDN